MKTNKTLHNSKIWLQLYQNREYVYWFDNPKPSQINGYNQHHFQALELITSFFNKNQNGALVGIFGPMGSGKSALLLLLADRYKGEYQAYVHNYDRKRNGNCKVITSWGAGQTIDAYIYQSSQDLINKLNQLSDKTIVLIDEWNFCDDNKIKVSWMQELVKIIKAKKLLVAISSLDFSFKKEIWHNAQICLSSCDLAVVLSSRCTYENCNKPAIFTQLNINSVPASVKTKTIHVGKVTSEFPPRCSRHHELNE